MILKNLQGNLNMIYIRSFCFQNSYVNSHLSSSSKTLRVVPMELLASQTIWDPSSSLDRSPINKDLAVTLSRCPLLYQLNVTSSGLASPLQDIEASLPSRCTCIKKIYTFDVCLVKWKTRQINECMRKPGKNNRVFNAFYIRKCFFYQIFQRTKYDDYRWLKCMANINFYLRIFVHKQARRHTV